MQTVGRYSAVKNLPSSDRALEVAEAFRSMVEKWLISKGEVGEHTGGQGRRRFRLHLRDGREAELSRQDFRSSLGRLRKWEILEPTRDGQNFRTSLSICNHDDSLILAATLSIGSRTTSIRPVTPDPHCPKIVRELLLDGDWGVGGTILRPAPERFVGPSRGGKLASRIQTQTRVLPIIAISEFEGLPLHPKLSENISYDLVGLAHVVEIDPDASWALTESLGRQWSCFHGAIRIYWPTRNLPEARQHPLWTGSSLIHRFGDAISAARQVRSEIRRLVFRVSCAGFGEYPILEKIPRKSALEDFERKLAKAKESQDLEELISAYDEENDRLREENDSLWNELTEKTGRVDALEAELEAASQQLHHFRNELDSGTTLAPDLETPPATVEEAVKFARSNFGGTLVFGDQVEEGVRQLASDAGPPEKILSYLKGLRDLGRELSQGTLGNSIGGWLRDRNLSYSGETAAVRRSRDRRQKRTWKVQGEPLFFQDHMKPNDATSPDRCVRIYFAWSVDQKRILIGWVGPHP